MAMYFGFLASSFSFVRSRAMLTWSRCDSPTYSLPHTFSNIWSGVSSLPALRAKYEISLYSVAVRLTSCPARVTRRCVKSIVSSSQRKSHSGRSSQSVERRAERPGPGPSVPVQIMAWLCSRPHRRPVPARVLPLRPWPSPLPPAPVRTRGFVVEPPSHPCRAL